MWSVHAPKLAGMDDWYLARQLRHFRDKVRGAHPEDDLGHQMQLMVSVLGDDQAIMMWLCIYPGWATATLAM